MSTIAGPCLTLEQQPGNRLVGGAPGGCGRFRFHAAPGAPGDAGRCHDGRYVIGGERIGLAPARRLAGETLQNAADAIMAGRIIGAGVNVAGADRGPAFAVVLCTVSRPALDTDRSQTDGKTSCQPARRRLSTACHHARDTEPGYHLGGLVYPRSSGSTGPAGSCTAMGCESGVKRARSRPPGVRFPSLFDMQLGATPIAIGRRSTT